MNQNNFQSPNPTCEKDCRFARGSEFTTLAFYQPLYDKHGNLVSKDGNTTTGAMNCVVCKKKWSYISSFGVTTYFEYDDRISANKA
jgi:hypothetical protein